MVDTTNYDIFDVMIGEIRRMQRENIFNEKTLASYYSISVKYQLSSKLHAKLEEIGYPSKFNAKNYYCLMVLISDCYFKVPIHTGMFNFLIQKLFGLHQQDKNMTRFCSIVKKLNNDVLQKLANIMAKSSRTVISNVTNSDFLKLLNS